MTVVQSGVTLDRKRVEFISPTATIRPLGDRIFVRPLPNITSKVLSVVHEGRALRGVVTHVGPGYREKKRYKNSRGETVKIGETGRVTPVELRPGDVVELGGLEISGYSFPKVMIGNVEHLIVQERDVAIVVEPDEDGPKAA